MIRRLVLFTVFLLLLLSAALLAAQDDEMATVRVFHNARGVGPVDIFLDGEPAGIAGLEFGEFSDPVMLPVGAYNFGVGAAGSDSPDFNIITRLEAGELALITAALDGERVRLSKVEDVTRVRVVHDARGVGPVDVFVNGERSAIQGLEFGAATDYVELPVGTYNFGVGAAGANEPDFNIITRLEPGAFTSITASLMGERVLLARADDTAFVKVFHNADGVGPVDVFLDGDLTGIQGLEFGQLSDPVALPPGAYNFGVGAAGSGDPDFNLITRLEPGSQSVVTAALDGERVRLSKAEDVARVRVVHNADGVGPVDVFVNDALSGLQGVEFGTTTDFVDLTSGVYNFGVAPAGASEPDFNIIARLNPGTETTITAALDGERLRLSRDTRVPPPPGPAFVQVAHNAADVGPVDVFIDGELTDIQGLEFGQRTAFIELEPGAYNFGVGAAGSGDPDFNLITRLQPDSFVVISAEQEGERVRLAAASGAAYVRFGHFATDVEAVDALVDGEVVGSGLEFGGLTEWIAVEPGASRFSIGAAGTGNADFNITRNVQPGSFTTLIANRSNDGSRVDLRVIAEDYSVIAPTRARVTVVNAIPGTLPINLQLDNGTILIQNLGFPGTLGDNDGVAEIELAPGAYNFEITPNGLPGNVILFFNGLNLPAATDTIIFAYGPAPAPSILAAQTDPADFLD